MRVYYKLNNNVTNEMLEEKGFYIEETRNYLWAIREGETNDRTIILKLNPPERLFMFRYQTSDLKYDLGEELKDINDWITKI